MRSSDAALRKLLGVVVVLHGAAHFAGTADALDRPGDGRAVEYLGGSATITDRPLRAGIGALWAAAIGVVVSAALLAIALAAVARAEPRPS